MPIDLDKYYKLPEQAFKSDKQLLDYMAKDLAYTTTELQGFLKIEHPATLQRLKKLEAKGFVDRREEKRKHLWHKIKEWPEEEDEIQLDRSSMSVL